MKKFFKDFGAFIHRGSVLDLAVGMIVGTAFNKIVSSMVNDIIMPAVGSILKVNVTEAKLVLVKAVLDSEGNIVTPAVTLNYGNFIQTIIDFLIIAFSVFVMIRTINKVRSKAKEEAEVKAKEEEVKAPTTNELLTEIIALLKEKEAK